MGAEVGIASVCGGTILTLVFLSLLGKNVKKRRRATGSKYTPDTQAGNQEDGGDEGGGGDAYASAGRAGTNSHSATSSRTTATTVRLARHEDPGYQLAQQKNAKETADATFISFLAQAV
eukprot:CAMPEP_0178994468 /NCGR_PEP_ID=MMETSP0795-20121207/7286_1 /TAXON_ID=88552 /ORGANISM="Amoebophrya sp., Strain Ameob2" /LENGTH=118 /DNA_ID=CAMNT_0020686663 /DNA_START=64 /DNA_END=421 /DNA_ORIENTATION=-